MTNENLTLDNISVYDEFNNYFDNLKIDKEETLNFISLSEAYDLGKESTDDIYFGFSDSDPAYCMMKVLKVYDDYIFSKESFLAHYFTINFSSIVKIEIEMNKNYKPSSVVVNIDDYVINA